MILSLHGICLSKVAATPQKALGIAAQVGFKHIELPVTTWTPLTDPLTEAQRKAVEITNMLEAYGIEASSLGMIWPRDYYIVTSSPAYWKRNLEYAKKLFDFSAALGVKVMNFGAPHARSILANVPYYEGFQVLIKFWKEACKYAEDVGVIVCIEHILRFHFNNVADTTKQILDLIEAVDSPSFQMVAQVHQMVFTDLDAPAAIRAAGKKIKLVHIADVLGSNPIKDSRGFIIPGRGVLDFDSIFRALKDVGYDGEICMEPSPNALSNEYLLELKEGREFLEAKWRD